MTPIRVIVEQQGGLWRRVEVRCPCCQVGRLVAIFDDVETVIAELRAQHRRESPTCQHPWIPRTVRA